MVLFAVPGRVSGCLLGFSSLSHHQRLLVGEYVTGLIASGSKSALGISRSVVGSHYKSLERLLTEYSFSCDGLNAERLALLDSHNETRSSAHGVLIVDDTDVEKEMPEAYNYYDHVDHCFKHGFVLVTLGYADHKTSYPVDVERYVPREVALGNFKTKIEISEGARRA